MPRTLFHHPPVPTIRSLWLSLQINSIPCSNVELNLNKLLIWSSLKEWSTQGWASPREQIAEQASESLFVSVHEIGSPVHDCVDSSWRQRAMSRPLQQLILEVLKSRSPSLDFKSYLNVFGGRSSRVRPEFFSQKSPTPLSNVPSGVTLTPNGASHASHGAGTAESSANLQRDATNVADRVSENEEADSLPESHTALVKLQGPFTNRQLLSIAEGLAYLKQLGLLCVVVVDHDGWNAAARYDADGRLVGPEPSELYPWLPSPGTSEADAATICGWEEMGQRHNMVHTLWHVSSIFSRAGVNPRPFGHATMRVVPANMLPSSKVDHEGATLAQTHRAPLAADCALEGVFRALDAGQTPILIPLALYDESGPSCAEAAGALRMVCVEANDVMVALAREMANAEKRIETLPNVSIDMTPLRLMVINREGGIPSHARNGNPHLSINLRSEYESIRSSFVWHDTHPSALSNLDMVRDCLAYMPPTSSGVMVTHRSPRSLIANLITNKAAHSPSLPQRLLSRRQDVRHTPTILRSGLSIRVLTDWDEVDQDKLHQLLEKSFRRTLNRAAYFDRLQKHLDFLIVTGDYDGLAIVTKERAPDDPPDAEPIAYLDKFAVLPKLQGSGAVDFLWGALRDEVHGLGLLDALNNNGGKNGLGVGRDLVWKSRANNPVNRWYFERSNGFVRLAPTFGLAADAPVPCEPAWVMFWCDAELRLAQLAGRNVLTSRSSMEEVRDTAYAQRGDPWAALPTARLPSESILPVIAREEFGRLERWEKCLAKIPSAWA